MADHSNSNLRRKPVAQVPTARKRGQSDLYQTRITLERALALAQHNNQQAVVILERALTLVEHVSSGKKSIKFLPAAADHIRSALALLDNEVTRD